MGTTRVVSISLPEETLQSAERLAEQENRTVDELIGEAVRIYQNKKLWSHLAAQGQQHARQLGFVEADVQRLIDEYRAER